MSSLDSDSLIISKNGVTSTYVLITYGNNHCKIIVIAINIDKFIDL